MTERKVKVAKKGNIDSDTVNPDMLHILRQINPYTIVHCMTMASLVIEVNDTVLKGFTPMGGISYDGTYYAQALFYTSKVPITRFYQSRSEQSVHSDSDNRDTPESSVRKTSTRSSATFKRSVPKR